MGQRNLISCSVGCLFLCFSVSLPLHLPQLLDLTVEVLCFLSRVRNTAWFLENPQVKKGEQFSYKQWGQPHLFQFCLYSETELGKAVPCEQNRVCQVWLHMHCSCVCVCFNVEFWLLTEMVISAACHLKGLDVISVWQQRWSHHFCGLCMYTQLHTRAVSWVRCDG